MINNKIDEVIKKMKERMILNKKCEEQRKYLEETAKKKKHFEKELSKRIKTK